MMRRSLHRFRRAFTLIEILIAGAAGAGLLAAVLAIYSPAIHAKKAAEERIRAVRLQSRAVETLRRDLRGARLSGGSLAVTLDSAATSQNSRFPGDLRFTTTSAAIDEGRFNDDLQTVEYYVAADEASPDGRSGKLVRVVTHNPMVSQEDVIVEEPLLHGVEQIATSFYDGTTWQDTWDPSSSGSTSSTTTTTTSTTAVPMGVRVQITLAPADPNSTGAHKVVEVMVPWTMEASTPTTTSGGGS